MYGMVWYVRYGKYSITVWYGLYGMLTHLGHLKEPQPELRLQLTCGSMLRGVVSHTKTSQSLHPIT